MATLDEPRWLWSASEELRLCVAKSLDELQRRINNGALNKQKRAIVPDQCGEGWGRATWRDSSMESTCQAM